MHMPPTPDTPPLKEGWVRWVHISSTSVLPDILSKGFSYKDQGMLSSTAHPFSSKEDADNYLQKARTDPQWDHRFTMIDGRMAVLVDLPEKLWRVHDMRSGEHEAPGLIPPEFIRGVVMGKDFSVQSVQPSPDTWSEQFQPKKPGKSVLQKPAAADSHREALDIPKPSQDDAPSVW